MNAYISLDIFWIFFPPELMAFKHVVAANSAPYEMFS